MFAGIFAKFMPYIIGGLVLMVLVGGAATAILFYKHQAAVAKLETEKEKTAVALAAVKSFETKRLADEDFMKAMNQSFTDMQASMKVLQTRLTTFNTQVQSNANSKRPLDPVERDALRGLFPTRPVAGANCGIPKAGTRPASP